MKNKYYRVTVKNDAGKKSSFWAEILTKGKILTTYRKVNKDGEDFGYYNKEDVLVDKRHLYSNSLIVSEKPAIEDLFYGGLVLDTPISRKRNADVIKSSPSRRKCPRITPKTPKLRR